MNNLTINNQNTNTGVITLKEITDLINVEHNKAMKIVEKLVEEPNFGTVEKIATVYNSKGQTIQTYILNKKQAIAVGAKLNNSLLMKVIDRVEELESKNSFVLDQKFDDTLKALSQKSVEVDKYKDKYLQTLELSNRLLLEKLNEKEAPKKDKYLSDEEKSIIRTKFKQGQTILSIARQIQRSESAVRYTLKKTA